MEGGAIQAVMAFDVARIGAMIAENSIDRSGFGDGILWDISEQGVILVATFEIARGNLENEGAGAGGFVAIGFFWVAVCYLGGARPYSVGYSRKLTVSGALRPFFLLSAPQHEVRPCRARRS
jgi:hypothetical protein